jgi:NADPH-dependent 2,4-dienoyl-CoA reductase/sulfur reductase-like enzyme/nitrite reductase/ring-hydroxylating ferredoxin subunit
MASDQATVTGPDLAQGVAASDLSDGGKLVGHVGDDPVLLVRRGAEIFAVGATCTHYNGPLGEGLVVGDTVRCPWHHACFDLRTGEAVAAPALSPIACWSVEQKDGKIFVGDKRAESRSSPLRMPSGAPEKIVIVGGGAGGFAAAEMLRRREYQGSIVMLSSDTAPPIDRPNLSKDYLAGSAPYDWLPLRSDSYYSKNRIELRLGTEVTGIDTGARSVVLSDGSTIAYDRLLLATGAEPRRLKIPGADAPHVYTLRSLRDAQRIIEQAEKSRTAVVIGASFIGLEVAASLRARDVQVHVVASDKRPMERVLGPEMGDFIRALHEEHGVVFHLGETPQAVEGREVVLQSGTRLKADFVVAGIGVSPRTELAERAGLTMDRGVLVDGFLETSAPGVFAVGDIVRWPDPYSGANIRVEHWVVAERQGQTAALNMLGARERFSAIPFFWSQHYDIPINYVGHAEGWDEIDIDGDIAGKDCLLRYKTKGRVLAVASIFRDIESLKAELAMERDAEKAELVR